MIIRCLPDGTLLISIEKNIENMDEILMERQRVINVYDVWGKINASLILLITILLNHPYFQCVFDWRCPTTRLEVSYYSLAKKLKTTIARDIPFKSTILKIRTLSEIFNFFVFFLWGFFSWVMTAVFLRFFIFIQLIWCPAWNKIPDWTSKFSKLCDLSLKVSTIFVNFHC